MPRLVVHGPCPRVVPLSRTKSITLGRSDENPVVLEDPEISRVHCRIEPLGGGHTAPELPRAGPGGEGRRGGSRRETPGGAAAHGPPRPASRLTSSFAHSWRRFSTNWSGSPATKPACCCSTTRAPNSCSRLSVVTLHAGRFSPRSGDLLGPWSIEQSRVGPLFRNPHHPFTPRRAGRRASR